MAPRPVNAAAIPATASLFILQNTQDKRFGNKGTLTKYYIQNPNTGKTELTISYEYNKEVPKKGFWSKLFGRSKFLPQIQIFGSGYSQYGNKADPDLPIVSFDMSNDELFSLLLIGREGPEKYGPLSGVDKFEEAVKYLIRLKEEHNNKKVKEEFKVKSTVVVD